MSVLESSFSTSDCALPCVKPLSNSFTSNRFSTDVLSQFPAFQSHSLYSEDTALESFALSNYSPLTDLTNPPSHTMETLVSSTANYASPASATDDPLLNVDISAPPGERSMIFYGPELSVVAPMAQAAVHSGETIVAGATSIASGENPRVFNITDLPQEILNGSPGLANAVANDGRDDGDTIQGVIKWIKAERATDTLGKATIYLPPGTYDLAETVNVNAGNITFKGAGKGRTRLKPTNQFKVGITGLPDGEIELGSANRNAYLFDLGKWADNVSFRGMALKGADIHGAIFANRADGLTINNVEFNDFLWSAVRLFSASDATIHNNTFIDAGGEAENGVTGGTIFATYLKDSEISHNRISKSGEQERNVYGIKGRQFENTRIHHNTIRTNFAIELPFEHDSFVEIDHNFLDGVISVPKFAGGKVPKDGFTFHIHHNYFKQSYSLEWARNGAEVNNNVFAFDPAKDYGNLISNFDPDPAQGPTKFHNNLILNPGRGIAWHKGIYNNFAFYNNEVIANTTATPRKEGFFGFNEKTDFSTIEIRDNVIKANGIARPLMRNQASYGAVIENNTLVNIADVDKFNNRSTGARRGLLAPLRFNLGAGEEFSVDGPDLTRNGSATSSKNSKKT